MTFQIIDKKTGKEPTQRVVDNIARKGHLLEFDIDQFAVCEDLFDDILEDALCCEYVVILYMKFAKNENAEE